MSLVRLLGFQTLSCGCVTGKYREVATSREVTYVEEKGPTCSLHGHRSNHAVAPERTFARVSTPRLQSLLSVVPRESGGLLTVQSLTVPRRPSLTPP